MNNIKKLRLEQGLSQKELAVEIGVSQPTASAWENGSKFPSGENLMKLATRLDTSAEYLLGATDSPQSPISGNILRIPVYGTIPAGVPLEAIESILDTEEAPAEWARGGQEFFALKIRGDSMFPKYQADDVVIFRKTPDCENGQECAVMINGQDATFKKVFKNMQGITLQPLNPEYEPRFFSNEDAEKLPIKILGVVKEIRRTVG